MRDSFDFVETSQDPDLHGTTSTVPAFTRLGPCKQICVEMEPMAAMRTHLKKKDHRASRMLCTEQGFNLTAFRIIL